MIVTVKCSAGTEMHPKYIMLHKIEDNPADCFWEEIENVRLATFGQQG